MAKDQPTPQPDPTTEEKIKHAARQVFHQKGFAATRTRDIAEAAGINLALLNYYFRSKEKLFDIIMTETLQNFLQTIRLTFNDPNTSLHEKLEILADRYIDLHTREPEIPLFIMSELRTNPKKILDTIHPRENLMHSVFLQQFQQAIADKEIPPQNFLHFLMNLMGLINFPFIASPMFKNIGNLTDEQYNNIIQERKKLIPKWANAVMHIAPDTL
jgi:AcrR family transcriptional regulator